MTYKDSVAWISIVLAWVVLTPLMLTKCDVEYAREHPTAETYISPADQVYLDIRRYDGE